MIESSHSLFSRHSSDINSHVPLHSLISLCHQISSKRHGTFRLLSRPGGIPGRFVTVKFIFIHCKLAQQFGQDTLAKDLMNWF